MNLLHKEQIEKNIQAAQTKGQRGRKAIEPQKEKTKARQAAWSRKKRFLLAYTLLFALLYGLILYYFLSESRSLVYHADAWRQHLRAYAYYGKWLRGVVWNIVCNHSLSLQSWSFGLGYGADVLTTLQYYCFGEPLTFLLILVPEKYTKYYYEFLMVLRPYLAGLCFSSYAKYVLRKSEAGILAGSICYAFCGTVLYLGMLHPFFVTPMIYLPLLLLGIEKILQEKRPAAFILTVWMAGLTNFYFFYMLAIMAAGYAVYRVIVCERRSAGCAGTAGAGERLADQDRSQAESGRTMQITRGKVQGCILRQVIRQLLALLGYAVVGTMMSCGILIPVLIQFAGNPRSDTQFSLSLFYEPEYYKELLENLTSFINHPSYDTELAMSAVCAAALVILLLRKGHRQIKTAVVLCTLMLCLPAAGYVMNGCSYVINRWTFAAEFLLAFVLTAVWQDLELELRNHGRRQNRDDLAAENTACNAACILLTATAIAWNIHSGYANIPAGEDVSGGQDGFPTEFIDAQDPDQYEYASTRNEAAIVSEYAAESGEEGFYRYSGRDLTYNAGAQTGQPSTQFFWSLTSDVVSNFFQALGVYEEQNFCYTGVDDRTILEALAGVRFYTIAYDNETEQRYVPYGFEDCGSYAADGAVNAQENSETDAGSDGADDKDDAQAQNDQEPAAEESEATVSGNDTDSQQGTAAGWSDSVYGDDSWELDQPTYHLYRSSFALPIGYTYEGVISKSSWESMTLTERQEAITQGVLLEDDAVDQLASQSCSEQPDAADTGKIDTANSGETGTAGFSEMETQGSDSSAVLQEIQPTFYESVLDYTMETSGDIAVSCAGGNSESTSDVEQMVQDQGNDSTGEQTEQNQETGGVVFTVREAGASVTLDIESRQEAETYLVLQDLNVTAETSTGITDSDAVRAETGNNDAEAGTTDAEAELQEVYSIQVSSSRYGEEVVSKTIQYKTPKSQYYSGWKDFALNLGYDKETPDTITITFQSAGTYTVSNLQVVSQPMKEVMENVVWLQASSMTETDMHQNPVSGATNTITGKVTAEKDRYLVFSIPYSSGWTAYDNGQKVTLQKANVMYMGIPITAGEHEITLVYHTPGSRIGGVLALLGTILAICVMMRRKEG